MPTLATWGLHGYEVGHGSLETANEVAGGEGHEVVVKDVKVKMSENLSSWALQSRGEKARPEEPRVDGPTSRPSWPSCQVGTQPGSPLGQPLPSLTAPMVESFPLGELKCECP